MYKERERAYASHCVVSSSRRPATAIARYTNISEEAQGKLGMVALACNLSTQDAVTNGCQEFMASHVEMHILPAVRLPTWAAGTPCLKKENKNRKF